MPDWNPDREGHRGHKWLIHDATRERLPGVETSKGLLKFNDEGRCLVNDESLANEIRSSEIGKRDVCVTRVTAEHPSDRGHTYHFGQFPGLPWAKYDEFGRRIADEEDDDGRE